MLIFIPQNGSESESDENRPQFYKANFIPLELTILCLFLHNHG